MLRRYSPTDRVRGFVWLMRQMWEDVHQVRADLAEVQHDTWRATRLAELDTLSPIDSFIRKSYATRTDGLFHYTYDLWRVMRMSKVLEIYGLDEIPGTRVVELGAGHADMGALLASLGASVTCVDGRVDNLNFAKLKHRHVDGLTFVQADLDEDFSSLGQFDLVLHFGLLYHIADVEQHLSRCFELADDIVLESVVCDSTDPHKILIVDADAKLNEMAISGVGSRPSPAYIERIAVEHGFQIERHFTSDLNSLDYVYDWEHKNNDDPGGYDQRRFWRLRRESS